MSNLSSADLKKLKDGIVEISNSLTRQEAEKDNIKSIVDELSDKLSIDKKLIRKLGKTYHKSNFNEEEEAFREFEDLFEAITK